ncbi:hypothetical protein [Sandaracinus amylolyticus]|uniref:hypothetical protein n=1 Tax=Sandaracinus amylolyticus TaxID=927083 RepID=UPI001F1F6C18|nr:hypothetical protein [Sandaracinus amylolyticus]
MKQLGLSAAIVIALSSTLVPALASAQSSAQCLRATQLWSDDFETGDHRRWTGRSYSEDWGDQCQSTGITTARRHSGRYAQRSEIVCESSSPEGVHRGYGGLQVDPRGRVLPAHTNSGAGLDAPHGIVTTFWTWLDAGYAFENGRWMSLFTINPSCDYTDRVVTLGLDQRDGVMRAAHYWPEATQTIEPGAPAMPLRQWVRVTVYMNLYTGDMHVWQNGESVLHVEGLHRRLTTMCQWHWGLYASADNTDVEMYEDDKIVWRLDAPYEDWAHEPWMGQAGATRRVCR